MISPVVLFVFNRVEHTREVLNGLMKNTLAKKTKLYIFSDAEKCEKDREKVKAVRTLIHSDRVKEAFADVEIIEAQQNKGLAPSIINGVTRVIEKYGRVIVLEDDSVPSPDYLEFMNNCLDYYQYDKRIWSIGGYSFLDKLPDAYKDDVYIMGRTCSYAWATWKERWEKVDWSVADYKSFRWNLRARKAFNCYGNDRAVMLDAQQIGRTSSWSIRFCYAMFQNQMFTVYPRYSRIKNIGQDGSGTNFTKPTQIPEFLTEDYIRQEKVMDLSSPQLNDEIYRQFIRHYTLSSGNLVKKYIKNIFYIIQKIGDKENVQKSNK